MLAMVEDKKMPLSDSIRHILSLAVALSHPLFTALHLSRSLDYSLTRGMTLCATVQAGGSWGASTVRVVDARILPALDNDGEFTLRSITLSYATA